MDAQRRGAERHADQDPARLLLERVRCAELPTKRLRLAAWLGDPAAHAAGDALGLEAPPEDLVGWVLGVARWGREAFVRLQVSALRAACALHRDPASRAAAEVLLDALDDWTRDPETHRDQVLALLETQLAPNVGQTLSQRGNPSDWVIVGAVQVAARTVRAEWVAEARVATQLPLDTEPARLKAIQNHFAEHGAVVRWHPGDAGFELWVADCGRIGAGGVTKALLPLIELDPLDLIERLFPVRERASPVVYAARVAGEESVRNAIRAALVPWALA